MIYVFTINVSMCIHIQHKLIYKLYKGERHRVATIKIHYSRNNGDIGSKHLKKIPANNGGWKGG